MSSSGLIYAVIVGAWAAYLVPMWLRRQDELNEARPTERFSTAIRLLSGKAAMERRYAKDAERRATQSDDGDEAEKPADEPAQDADPDDRPDHAVDVRAFADPLTMAGRARPGTRTGAPAARPRGERSKRAQALARRRRTTMVLFLAFTCGAIVAAVGGLAFLWAPGVPAALLSVYIVHLRRQERRRFTVVMDRRRAEIAAQRL
ncbi:MAG TPA: gephyrin-like molybdotransferase receptor GlpR, partial [Streptomyces sp.]|nr:gephyrin-like molybdotransferase receptor GlpR [Streptomyces sp.]